MKFDSMTNLRRIELSLHTASAVQRIYDVDSAEINHIYLSCITKSQIVPRALDVGLDLT